MKSQAKEDASRERLDVVAIARLVARAQAAVFLEQGIVVLGRGILERKLELCQLVAHGGDVGYGGHDLVDDAATLHLDGFLLQKAQGGALGVDDLTGVWALVAGEDVHHRRLAGAVGADQGDAVALVDTEGDIREESADAEGFGDVNNVENHKVLVYQLTVGNQRPRLVNKPQTTKKAAFRRPFGCCWWAILGSNQ